MFNRLPLSGKVPFFIGEHLSGGILNTPVEVELATKDAYKFHMASDRKTIISEEAGVFSISVSQLARTLEESVSIYYRIEADGAVIGHGYMPGGFGDIVVERKHRLSRGSTIRFIITSTVNGIVTPIELWNGGHSSISITKISD